MTEKTLSKRLNQPSSFMLISEDLTHLLDRAVDDASYPMQVEVSISISPPEPEGTCKYEDCEADAETVVLYRDTDFFDDFCGGHAGQVVKERDHAVVLNEETMPLEDCESTGIQSETCPNCDEPTNKFLGECDHCGFNRWNNSDN